MATNSKEYMRNYKNRVRNRGRGFDLDKAEKFLELAFDKYKLDADEAFYCWRYAFNRNHFGHFKIKPLFN